MKKYKIKEIFSSIQGEGHHAGLPVTFIRFSGCNKNCIFCDTDHENGTDILLEDLIKQVQELSNETVVLTGGEPLLRIDAELLEELKYVDKKIHIETNGSIGWFKFGKKIDWITVSPKQIEVINYEQNRANEVKLIVNKDVNEYDLKLYVKEIKAQYYYLQPMDEKDEAKNKANIDKTIELINKHRGLFRLSMQLHKILGLK